MGLSETTTPAAWVEAWRDSPSSRMETSSSLRICGSVLYSAARSGSASMAFLTVILRSSGTSLAMRSVSAKVMPRARPTSRTTAFAFIFPKVVIWATMSSPYFSPTYRMTSPRRRSQKSTSISGMDTRSMFRKRSNSRLYGMGSRLVMRSDHATSEPAADPRPGPTGMPLSLAQLIKSCTMRK